MQRPSRQLSIDWQSPSVESIPEEDSSFARPRRSVVWSRIRESFALGGPEDDEVVNRAIGKLSSIKTFRNRRGLDALRYRSLFLFTPDSSIRLHVFNIVQHQLFEAFILLAIFTNCIFLALNDRSERISQRVFDISELVFTCIFVVEMLAKIIAYGFIMHAHSYLRNSWNVLDFLIVLISAVALLPGIQSTGASAARTVRVLRPLRSINGVPGLRTIVSSILKSIRSLVNVLLLTFFVFFVFGVLGIQLWSGRLKYRCVSADNPGDPYDTDNLCSRNAYSESGVLGRKCPEGFTCEAVGNPDGGMTSFDNILRSSLIVFQVFSLQDWSSMSYMIWDAWSVFGLAYFIVLVIFGGFVVINLALAVINEEFNENARLIAKMSADALWTGGQQSMKTALAREKRRMRRMSRHRGSEVDQLSMIFAGHRLSMRMNTSGKQYSVQFFQDRARALWRRVTSHIFYYTNSRWFLRVRRFFDRINCSPVFRWGVIALILCNTIVLAADHYGQSDQMAYILDVLNAVFTFCFVIEVLVKLFAIGLTAYFTDPFNNLDVIVVVVSVVELFASSTNAFSVFRTLRLLRVLKMLKQFKQLRSVIHVIAKAAKETGFLNLIIFLFLFMAALLGQQIFAGYYTSRVNFDVFYWSMMAVFQVLTLDNWVEIMHNGMQGLGSSVVALYFVFIVIIGTFLLLNLFLAIVIKGFQGHPRHAKKRKKKQLEIAKINGDRTSIVRSSFAQSSDGDETLLVLDSSDTDEFSQGQTKQDSSEEISYVKEDTSAGSTEQFDENKSVESDETMESREPMRLQSFRRSLGKYEDAKRRASVQVKNVRGRAASIAAVTRHEGMQQLLNMPFMSQAVKDVDRGGVVPRVDGVNAVSSIRMSRLKNQALDLARKTRGDLIELIGGAALLGASRGFYTPPRQVTTNGGSSLCIFGPSNWLRIKCTQIVSTIPPGYGKITEAVLMVCIVTSSLLLAFDDPFDNQTKLQQVLDTCNYFFTAIFAIEMIIKVIALGFFFGNGAYLKDPWNVTDFVIVSVTILALLPFQGFGFVKVLRTFRALRPLRVVGKNRGLKMVVRTLLKSIPGMLDVSVIATINYLIFGIMGVQFFGGKLQGCTDRNIVEASLCVASSDNGVLTPRSWGNLYPQNYDHILRSMLTMFEVSNLEGWGEIMYLSLDAYSPTHAPVKNHRPYTCIFFAVFIIIATFFIINLFVGVVVYNFQNIKLNMDGVVLLTNEQKRWLETQRLMLNFRPKMKVRKPTQLWRIPFYHLNKSVVFDYSVAGMVLLNSIFMAMEYEDMSIAYRWVLDGANYFFIVFFFIEAAIKIIASPKTYFGDKWNRFDFALVFLNIIGALLEILNLSKGVNMAALRLFRVFRVLRVVRLIQKFKQMQVLLQTLWYSLPSLSNIGVFLLLLFYVFAILGVNLFAKVKKTGALDRHANFDNVAIAMYLLFRMSTGENWNDVMHAVMIQPPDCERENDNCGVLYAPLYFIAFLLFASYIMLNLFIAIILDNFATAIEIQRSTLKMSHLTEFVDVWANYDENATYLINTFHLPALLKALGPPLGVDKEYTRLELLKKSGEYHIPEHGGKIHFIEVLIPLARKVMDVDLEAAEMEEQEDGWRFHFPDLYKLPVLKFDKKRVTVDQYFASTYIAAAYKRTQAMRRYKEFKCKMEGQDDIARKRAFMDFIKGKRANPLNPPRVPTPLEEDDELQLLELPGPAGVCSRNGGFELMNDSCPPEAPLPVEPAGRSVFVMPSNFRSSSDSPTTPSGRSSPPMVPFNLARKTTANPKKLAARVDAVLPFTCVDDLPAVHFSSVIRGAGGAK